MKPSLKISILSFVVLIFFSNHIRSQNLTKEQAQQDIVFLANALKEGHPGLYWYNSRDAFDEVVSPVATDLGETTTISKLHSGLVDIINTISCGHTAVSLPKDYYQSIDSINRFLPFNIALVEGKVLVAESFTETLSHGDQILSINGEPISHIIRDLQRFIPVDKGIQTKRARSIEIMFSYSYAVYKGSPSVFNIEYENKSGKKLKGAISAIGRNDYMLKSARDFASVQVPIEWEIDASENYAKLKIVTFGPQSYKQHQINFQDTIMQIFTQLEKNKIKNLIIDLRWNNGGSMRFAEHLFSFFIDSTYRYYQDAVVMQPVMEGTTKYAKTRNMLPMISRQFGELKPEDGVYHLSGKKNMVSPTKPRFNGNLYLLTNGFSFSATSAFISSVQQNDLGLIIGETPGGAFDAINAGPQVAVVLPNSKIRLFYRIIGSRYNVKEGKTKAVVDVKIENSFDAFMDGRDEQMEYVIEMIIKN